MGYQVSELPCTERLTKSKIKKVLLINFKSSVTKKHSMNTGLLKYVQYKFCDISTSASWRSVVIHTKATVTLLAM